MCNFVKKRLDDTHGVSRRVFDFISSRNSLAERSRSEDLYDYHSEDHSGDNNGEPGDMYYFDNSDVINAYVVSNNRYVHDNTVHGYLLVKKAYTKYVTLLYKLQDKTGSITHSHIMLYLFDYVDGFENGVIEYVRDKIHLVEKYTQQDDVHYAVDTEDELEDILWFVYGNVFTVNENRKPVTITAYGDFSDCLERFSRGFDIMQEEDELFEELLLPEVTLENNITKIKINK